MKTTTHFFSEKHGKNLNSRSNLPSKNKNARGLIKARYGSDILTKNKMFMIFGCWHILTQKHLLFSLCDCFVSKMLLNVHILSVIGGAAQLCVTFHFFLFS